MMSLPIRSAPLQPHAPSDGHAQYPPLDHTHHSRQRSEDLTTLNIPAVEGAQDHVSNNSPINHSNSAMSRTTSMEKAYEQAGSSANGVASGQSDDEARTGQLGGSFSSSGTDAMDQSPDGHEYSTAATKIGHGAAGPAKRRPTPLSLGGYSNVQEGAALASRGLEVGSDHDGGVAGFAQTYRPCSSAAPLHGTEMAAFQSKPLVLPSIHPSTSNIGSASSPYAYSYAMRQQQQKAQMQVLSHGGERREEPGQGQVQGQESMKMQRSGSGQSTGISPLGDVRSGSAYFGQISPGDTNVVKDPMMRIGVGSGGQTSSYPSMYDAQNGQRDSAALEIRSNGYPAATHINTPYNGASPSYPTLPPLSAPGQAYAPMPYASHSGNVGTYGSYSDQPQPYQQQSHQSYTGYGSTLPPAASSIGPEILSRQSSGYGMTSGPEDEESMRLEGGYGSAIGAVDRPFKCDECTQSFSRNHDLKRHKRIHLTVKPFACDKCGKQFSRKDALRRHWLVKGCKSENSTGINPEFRANLPSLSPSSPPELSQPVATATSYFLGYNPSFQTHSTSFQPFQYPAARPQTLVRNFSSDTNGSTILTPQEATFPYSTAYPQQRYPQLTHRSSMIGPLDTPQSASKSYYDEGHQSASNSGSGLYPSSGPVALVPSYKAAGAGVSTDFSGAGQYVGSGYTYGISNLITNRPPAFGEPNLDDRPAPAVSLNAFSALRPFEMTDPRSVLIVQPDGLVPANKTGKERSENTTVQRSSGEHHLGSAEVVRDSGAVYQVTNSYGTQPSFQKPSVGSPAIMGRTSSVNSVTLPNTYTPGNFSPPTIASGAPRSPFSPSFQAGHFGQQMSRQSSLNPAQRQMSQQGLGEPHPADNQAGQIPRWNRSSFPFPAPTHQHHPSAGSDYQGGSEAVERSVHQTSHLQRSPVEEQGGQTQSQRLQEQYQSQNQTIAMGGRQWSRASFPFPAAAGAGSGVGVGVPGTMQQSG